MNLAALKAKLNALMAEANELSAKGDTITPEEVARFDAIMGTEESKGEWEITRAEIEALEASASTARERLAVANAAMNAPTKPRIQGASIIEVGADRRELDLKLGFANTGEFMRAVAHAQGFGGMSWDKRLDLCSSASGLTHGSMEDGALLMPPEFSSKIFESAMSVTDILPMTDGYTVEGESLTFKGEDESTHANGVVGGGVRAYWVNTAEADIMTASQPKFRNIKLTPHTLAVLVYATDDLLTKPIALEQYITRKAGDAISLKCGDAIFNGTGVGQPLGILASGATIEVAKQSGQAAATIKSENIIKMNARLHPKFRKGAAWFCNTDLQEQLPQLVMNVGTGGQLTFMPAGGLSGSEYDTLMGKPIIYTEYNQALGTKGDIVLGNLKQYVTGIRGGIQSAMSIHVRFLYNETAFRFLFKMDGQTEYNKALTPLHGTNTLSSFVTLAARA